MYHVLMPIGEKEAQAQQAVDALQAIPFSTDSIEVTILNVYEEFEVADDGGVMRSEDLYDERELPDTVFSVRDSLSEHQIPAEIQQEHGSPAEKIIEVAEELDTDLIVVCARKKTPVGKVLFGSKTQSVLLHADNPVLFAPFEGSG